MLTFCTSATEFGVVTPTKTSLILTSYHCFNSEIQFVTNNTDSHTRAE